MAVRCRVLRIAAVGALLVVSGCSSSGGDESTSSTEPASTAPSEVSSTTDAGAVDLPEEWPAELQPPDGAQLLSADSASQGDITSMLAGWMVPGDVASVLDDAQAQLESAGYGPTERSTVMDWDQVTGSNGAWDVTMVVTEAPGEPGSSLVSVTVATSV